MKSKDITELELLAPARDYETAIAAIDSGADAIYIGGPHHGARASASNSIGDIKRLCEYAHRFRCRIYVTLNTLVYDDELTEVRNTVYELYNAGVDALIVQDLALTAPGLPPIALHASTQCDARTPERARFLQDLGMSCIVLPREFTLDDIRRTRAAVSVRLEAFVHGALCVSYSGDCRASLVNGGRSANRGECAQICRLPFNLVDDRGNVIVADRHLLSLKDMNRLSRLADLAHAGISVFKIEGRLKDVNYVKTVVQAYSKALDSLCANNPERWRRASYGRVEPMTNPDVDKVFNRGFTTYFIDGDGPMRRNSPLMPLTPKYVGPEVARIKSIDGNSMIVDAASTLNNGDGLVYFDQNSKLQGFRVNRVTENRIFSAAPVSVRPGTVLYRNFDKVFDDESRAFRPSRTIGVDAVLDCVSDNRLALTFTDQRGCRATVVSDEISQPAEKNQSEVHARTISKLGGTIYRLNTLTDNASARFVPASTLTALRRAAVSAIDRAASATYRFNYRNETIKDTAWPEGDTVSFHQNVANSVAAGIYRKHGVSNVSMAMEVDQPRVDDEDHVMTTRHCIRRHLGACLKTAGRNKLPDKLFLAPASADANVRTMRIAFDCEACCMKLYALPRSQSF